jgi:hypothetical protein
VTDHERSSEELLQEIADGDVSTLVPLVQNASRLREAAGLDEDEFQLAEVAALAAVDASPTSWFAHLAAHPAPVDIDKLVGALIAVTPIVGTPRIVSAAANIIGATRLAEELDEAP